MVYLSALLTEKVDCYVATFQDSCIHRNFSNYSAWHQRSFLLAQRAAPFPVSIPDLVQELILVRKAVFTEETLSAMQQAISKHAQIICVTSGGKVHELAQHHQFDTIIIPGGHPPRSCIGYSLIQLLKIVQFNGFVKTDLLQHKREI